MISLLFFPGKIRQNNLVLRMKGTISFQFSIDFHKSENCMEFFMCIAPEEL